MGLDCFEKNCLFCPLPDSVEDWENCRISYFVIDHTDSFKHFLWSGQSTGLDI